MTFKAMKFRVAGKAHSEAIQLALFELGYRWAGTHTGIEKTDKQFLFADGEDGKIRYNGEWSGSSYFDEHASPEYMLYQGNIVPSFPAVLHGSESQPCYVPDFSSLEARILAMDECTPKRIVVLEELDDDVQRRHVVRSWSMFFRDIITGERTADIRLRDREYRVGDEMLLQEYDPVEETYTGREQLVKITYIQGGKSNPCAISHLALDDKYVVLSIKKV